MIQRSNNQEEAPAGPHNRVPPQAMATVQPTRSPRREVQVGVFVLAGILAVVAALFILTDPGTFRGRYYVSTVVKDAGGIRQRDPVQQNGVNIGRVDDLRLTPQGVAMRLEIEGRYKFPVDSRVQLAANGLLGEMVAEIHPGSSARLAQSGDVLASGDATGGLSGQAQQLGDKADTLLTSANAMLNRQTVGAVQASAQELQTLLNSLSVMAAEQRSQLNALSGSLNRSARGVEGAATRPELARAIARTDSISLQLDQATRQLNQSTASMAVVLGRLERGEGTMGKLMTDDSLYVNLNSTLTNLNQLTNDIRANPKKYLSVSVF
jgi:phospholipid/cholesterol/gamma-HCH transport system substrate-binding protein